MKKIVVLSGALLALAAPMAMAAGLDLSWAACPGNSGALSNEVFDCASAATGMENLYGRFTVPQAINNVFAMDWAMDVQVEAAALPTFWQMEMGDCNDMYGPGGYVLFWLKPVGVCGTPSNPVATWGTTGAVDAYQWWLDAGHGNVPPGANRARFLCNLRRQSTGINLAVGTNYFGFEITISDATARESGGSCDGCRDAACIVWNATSLIPGIGAPLVVEGPGAFGNAASVNGGTSSCLATAARKKTWGQIKALYR